MNQSKKLINHMIDGNIGFKLIYGYIKIVLTKNPTNLEKLNIDRQNRKKLDSLGGLILKSFPSILLRNKISTISFIYLESIMC